MKPEASALMLTLAKLPSLPAFTTCSVPTLAPDASKSWSLTELAAWPPGNVVAPCQATANPVPRAMMLDGPWLPAISVLTRISPPTFTPAASKIWALIPEPEASPPTPLASVQLTTKPPPARSEIEGVAWLALVAVLTRNSVPTSVPFASYSWPRTALLLVSPPVTLASVQVIANRPEASAVTTGET